MPVLTRTRQPRPEARIAFDLLIEMLEGRGRLDEPAVYDRVSRFVAVLQQVSGKMVRWKWELNPYEQKEILSWVASGLEKLRSGQVFQYSYEPEASPQGIIWDADRGLVGRAPSNHLKNLFFDLAFDLLIEIGPWLRVCQREDCGRFFLYRRPKQAFCSEGCAQRVRTARFLDQQKAKPPKRSVKHARRALEQQARAKKKR
jgi:hypothetical protein